MNPEVRNVYAVLHEMTVDDVDRWSARALAAREAAEGAGLLSRRALQMRAEDCAAEADAAQARRAAVMRALRSADAEAQREARELAKARTPAEILATVKPKAAKKNGNGNGNGRHPREKYPWDEWFDGREHVIRRGVDFDFTPFKFTRQIRVKARNSGLYVSVRADEVNPDVLTVRASRTPIRQKAAA